MARCDKVSHRSREKRNWNDQSTKISQDWRVGAKLPSAVPSAQLHPFHSCIQCKWDATWSVHRSFLVRSFKDVSLGEHGLTTKWCWKLQISGQQIEVGLLLNVVEHYLLCQSASFCAMPFSKEGRSDSRKWTTDFLHTWTLYNHYIALDMEVLAMLATGVVRGQTNMEQFWHHHPSLCFHLQDSSSFSNQLRDCQQFSQCLARVWCVTGHCRSQVCYQP